MPYAGCTATAVLPWIGITKKSHFGSNPGIEALTWPQSCMFFGVSATVISTSFRAANADKVQLDGVKATEQFRPKWHKMASRNLELQSSRVLRPKRRLLPRSELKFELVSSSVSSTVADLLLRPGPSEGVRSWLGRRQIFGTFA